MNGWLIFTHLLALWLGGSVGLLVCGLCQMAARSEPRP